MEFTKNDSQIKQFFNVSKETDIYVASPASEQRYILELSKSLTSYQNVAYLTRMHCTANNAKAREPQRTGLMPCCANFSV